MDEFLIRDRLFSPLQREGYPFVLCAAVGTVVLGLIESIFWLPGFLATFFLYFSFRLPSATALGDSGMLLSPASGVVLISESGGGSGGSRDSYRVRLGITVLDPSVLRFPLSGKVLRRADSPSLPSGLDFSKARENAARVDLSVRPTDSTGDYGIHLRAGVIGRHISLDLADGSDIVEGSSYFGCLRFGGIVEITFDAGEYKPFVIVGQRVIAGETIIGLANARSSSAKSRASGASASASGTKEEEA